MTDQHPGPYGQQPPHPQANPYGQPPQQQPNPYGHPPQQPPSPYGQPYGQPRMPTPYGQYPTTPPLPPQRSGKGKAIGITVGALAIVGALVGGFFFFQGSGGDKRYRLTAPETVLGEYKKNGSDSSGPVDPKDEKVNAKLGIKGAHPVGGEYRSGAGADAKRLSFHGVWGRIDSPETTVDRLFELLKKNDGNDGDDATQYVGSPRKVTPKGLGGGAVMKCQAMRVSVPGGRNVDMPFCAWADHSTVAMVMNMDRASLLAGTATLDRCAGTAARLRDEIRVEREK
ncbi:hypothetical protein [Streptomyces sp. I05A-00742]|uniref:hypothetical protein n=1 Tax=Streptomyces sp. I05A-00742 TaxID=2732853 RepID=UPI001487BFEB|nr:hypothetical protein [Streptomyces sp. I05A-00742]